MNIFAVDADPIAAAQALHDRHVVKMCLETAQILCTLAHQHGLSAPYKPTHAKHPCTVWAGQSDFNATWLWWHGKSLCREYTYRFGKVHACEAIIRSMEIVLCVVPGGPLTHFAQVVPDDCKGPDAVEAYRKAYRLYKLPGNRYTRRDPPVWAQN